MTGLMPWMWLRRHTTAARAIVCISWGGGEWLTHQDGVCGGEKSQYSIYLRYVLTEYIGVVG